MKTAIPAARGPGGRLERGPRALGGAARPFFGPKRALVGLGISIYGNPHISHMFIVCELLVPMSQSSLIEIFHEQKQTYPWDINGIILDISPITTWLVVWNIICFPCIRFLIIPTDFHILQRGGKPPTSIVYVYVYISSTIMHYRLLRYL